MLSFCKVKETQLVGNSGAHKFKAILLTFVLYINF